MPNPSVLMYPAQTVEKDNPFIPILAGALRQQGVQLRDFNIYNPRQNAQVFHVHWPERVFQNRLGSRSGGIARLFAENMLRTAERVRQTGGRVVWTAHNLAPHDMPDPGRQRVWKTLRRRFFELVSDVAMLSGTAQPAIMAAIPELATARFHTVLHHHYRDFFAGIPAAGFRAAHGISERAVLYSNVGYIKRYKRTAELIAEFQRADIPDSHLVVAGRFEGSYKRDLGASAAEDARIILIDQALTHQQVASILGASTACVFNPQSQFNSGSLISALSLGTAAICPHFAAGHEIADMVGPDWMRETGSDVTADDLIKGAAQFGAADGRTPPDLGPLVPSAVAIRHLDAYGFSHNR